MGFTTMKFSWVIPLSMLLGVVPGYAEECRPTDMDSTYTFLTTPAVTLAYRFVPAPPRVGTFLAIDVIACATDGVSSIDDVRLDARMPAHGHGMNYRPSVTRIGPQRVRFEGLLLHMPGRWELAFDIVHQGKRRRLTHDVELHE